MELLTVSFLGPRSVYIAPGWVWKFSIDYSPDDNSNLSPSYSSSSPPSCI